ncbi:MAG TPA: ABC transporter substrate-binding protein [Candidatus Acetothermia bacterium]|nr:ABC transporter substrate-binding protein [Candidatus Acetothermia bacterium]
MLRKAALMALCGLFVLSLAGLAVEIDFWHPMSSRHQTNLQTLIDKFHAEYPDITVNLTYQGRYGDLEAKVGAAVVANELPTMTMGYENWFTPIAPILYPIGNHMSEAEIGDIIDGLIESNTYDGVLTTLPFNKSIMVLYYREDLVPNPPTTWEEFLAMSAALTQEDNDGDGYPDYYGTGFRPVNPELFLNFLDQAGGSILNEDWTEVEINDAAGLAAGEFVAALAPYSFITNEYMSDHFPRKLAMFIDTSAGYFYNNQAAENAGVVMRVARVPAGAASQRSMIQGTNLAIFDTDRYTQEQKEAAVTLAKFLIRPDNTVFWAINSGYQPVVKSAYETEEWLDFVEANPYQVAMSEQMVDGFSQILHPAYGDMRMIIATAFEEILEGVATAQEALDYAAEELELLLDE